MQLLGLTGIPACGPEGAITPLTNEEVAAVRKFVDEACPSLAAEARQAFESDLTRVAENLRAFIAIGRQGTKRARIANLRQAARSAVDLREFQSGLTIANRLFVDCLVRRQEAVQPKALAGRAIALIGSIALGRGDRRHEELDYGAISLRLSYEKHSGRKATGTKDGFFVLLIETIFSIATGKDYTAGHRLAERALAGGVIEESPGVTIFVPAGRMCNPVGCAG